MKDLFIFPSSDEGPPGGTPARVLASNNIKVPYGMYSSGTNYVRNYRQPFMLALGASWSSLELEFCNYASTNTTELATSPDVQIECAIEVGGALVPALFGGSSTGTLTVGGRITATCAIPSTEGGTLIFVNTRIVGPDTGSYVYPYGIDEDSIFGSWTKVGTDTAINYCDPAQNPYGAQAVATVTAGTISALTRISAGQNYNSSAFVMAYEVGNNGVTYTKQIGSVTVSGGGITTSFTITSGTPPAGLNAWRNPKIVIAYGRTGLTTTDAIIGYGPSRITGIPSKSKLAIIGIGDSIMRGNGTGLKPTGRQNLGLYEIGVSNNCGFMNFGIGGVTAASLANTALRPRYWALIEDTAQYAGYALVCAGTNDLGATGTYATITASLNSLGATLRGFGYSVSFGTILPKTTSTDAWVTTANQTVAAKYGTAQDRGLLNADIRSGAIVSDWGFVDGDMVARDSTDIDKIRCDGGVAYTTDGLHEGTLMRGVAAVNDAFKSKFEFLLS